MMASQEQVKAYIACWLQMGKAVDVDLPAGQHQVLLSRSVLEFGRYSDDFERIWRYIHRHANRCYLSGTTESVRELLSDRWDISNCSRCNLLLPMPAPLSLKTSICPCSDIVDWPNEDALRPRLSDDTEEVAERSLAGVVQRLQVVHG